MPSFHSFTPFSFPRCPHGSRGWAPGHWLSFESQQHRVSLVCRTTCLLAVTVTFFSQPRDVYFKKLRHAQDKFPLAETSSGCWTKYQLSWSGNPPELLLRAPTDHWSSPSFPPPPQQPYQQTSSRRRQAFTQSLAAATTCQQLKSLLSFAFSLAYPIPTCS